MPNVLLVDLVNYRLIGYGLVALAIMLLFPDGLVGTVENALRRRLRKSGGADVGIQRVMSATATPRASRSFAHARNGSAPAVSAERVRKGFGQVIALTGRRSRRRAAERSTAWWDPTARARRRSSMSFPD